MPTPRPSAAPLTPGEAVARQTVTAYTLSPAELQRSRALYHTRVVLSFGSTLLTLAVLAALVGRRFGPWVQRRAECWLRRRVWRTALATAALLLVLDLVQLPLGIYGQHVARVYGLSVQGWSSWMADWGKSQLLTLALAIPLVWGLYALIRRSPRRWWFYAWLCSLPIAAALVFAAPVAIDPLFQRFEPLARTHPELTVQLQKLARSGGLEIPTSRIFLMRASDKYTTYNAYVTGIGATKRIVVWDTTARDLTTPQILFVFGHEMGHYVLHHIYLGLAFTAGLLFVGLWLMQMLAETGLRLFGARWRIPSLGECASLPLLVLLATLLAFLSSPAANSFSRWEEHAADRYGLAITRRFEANSEDKAGPGAAQAAAQAFQLLGERSYSYPDPSPLLVFWSYSHPPLAQRIQYVLKSIHPESIDSRKHLKQQ